MLKEKFKEEKNNAFSKDQINRKTDKIFYKKRPKEPFH